MTERVDDDDLNALMERCLVVQGRCDSTSEFATIYSGTWDLGPEGPHHTDGPPYWLVGFYEPEYGKHNAQGPTLREALVAWLGNYEDWLGLDR